MTAEQAAPAVRRPEQVPASPLGPGVTAAEMLDDRHGCRGLHQRRLRFAGGGGFAGGTGSAGGGAGFAGTAGGQGEAWYVITGSGVLDTERTGCVALEPGTAVWLEPGLRLCVPGAADRGSGDPGRHRAGRIGRPGADAAGGTTGRLRAGAHR